MEQRLTRARKRLKTSDGSESTNSSTTGVSSRRPVCRAVPNSAASGSAMTHLAITEALRGALDKWVSSKAAPDEMTASFAAGGGSRKLCAYPKQAVYKGTGDGRSLDQFDCK